MLHKLSLFFCMGLVATSLVAYRSQADPMEAIRYVDIQRCLLEWQDLQDQSNAISDHYRSLSENLNQAYSELKGKKADLETLDSQSTEYGERSFALKIEEETLRARIEWTQGNYGQEQTALLERGVRHIQEVVAQLGAKEGYSAIMMEPGPLQPLSNKFTAKDSLSEMNSRWVLWSNPDYDLTDQVLLLLNQK